MRQSPGPSGCCPRRSARQKRLVHPPPLVDMLHVYSTKKKNEHAILTRCFVEFICAIGLASDDVTKLSNAWQRGKLVLNKDSAPYKSMLGEKSLTWRSSLFLLGEIGTVLTTPSRLNASHFKRSRGSDKCGAVFRSIDALPACFCMGAIFV